MYKLNPLIIPKFTTHFRRSLSYVPLIKKENEKIIYFYEVEACEFYQQMLPDEFPATKVWGFRGLCMDNISNMMCYQKSSPGPAFIMKRNVEAKVKWINNITGSYMFPVDGSLLWANPKDLESLGIYKPFPYGDFKLQAPAPMVINFHGAMTSPEYNGHPDGWFTANNLRGPVYQSEFSVMTNAQEPSTLWYHDNSRGLSRLNVYSGLSGPCIIKDIPNEVINDPEIQDEILVIQDRSFYEDASLYYPDKGEDLNEHPYWIPRFYGDVILVNGVSWPYLDITHNYYRFRIINASNSRIFDISLSDDSSFIQIASEGGYIDEPRSIKNCRLSPGERVEIIIDFSKYKNGDIIILKNQEENAIVGLCDLIMQFRVKRVNEYRLNIPAKLNNIENLIPDTSGKVSTIIKMEKHKGIINGIYMNGQENQNPSDIYSKMGSTYIWDFINLTDLDESIHLPLIQFQIISRKPINKNLYLKEWKDINGDRLLEEPTIFLDPSSFVIEAPESPKEYEGGWKDTVYLPPGYVTRIIVRYAPTYVNDAALGKNSFPFNPIFGGEYTISSSVFEHKDNQVSRPQYIIY